MMQEMLVVNLLGNAGIYYRENVNHPTAKYLERSVHRSIR